jgi:hypothetical protein
MTQEHVKRVPSEQIFHFEMTQVPSSTCSLLVDTYWPVAGNNAIQLWKKRSYKT